MTRKQRSDKGRKRKQYLSNWRRQKKLSTDLKQTQADILKFEILEAEKVGDHETAAAKQEELEGLQIVRATRKPRKSEAARLQEQQAEIERMERREQRKATMAERKRAARVRYETLHPDRKTRNEYKQEKRLAALPANRTCRKCGLVKTKTAQWVINNAIGTICKSCWTEIQRECKVYGIDVDKFCIEFALKDNSIAETCNGDIVNCRCLTCLLAKYLNRYPN